MEEIAVGIDAGTSNSVIGVYQKKKVEIVPNSIGDTYTPSTVAFLDEGELVGEETMLHKIDDNTSKNRITEIKRIIGKKFSTLTTEEIEKYNAIEEPKTGQILIKIKRKEKEEFLSPEHIMSLIFQKLINSASNFVNTTVKKAVITVPANFDNNRSAAIIESAKNAGIEVLRKINEPTAAALAYGLGTFDNLKDSLSMSIMKQDNKILRKVVVFDLGGGTFDVTILTIKDNKEFIALTSSGDSHLGGDDFDNKLVDYCINKFCNVSKVEEGEIRKNKNIIRRLKIQCEKAKKKLSYSQTTNITIYNFYNDSTLYVEFTREIFDSLCEDLYQRIKSVLDKAILAKNLTIEEIDDVVVVGGSSRIPKIKTILVEKFGLKKIRDQINPDEAVAIGATWQANKIIKSSHDINIIDITNQTLGIACKSKNLEEQAEGSIMSVLIPKDKKISCRSEEKKYRTVEDDQKFFKIQLYGGESHYCKNNQMLKEFIIDDLPKGKAGSVSLTVSLEINKDGIVFINAEVKSIGKKITEQYSLYEKRPSGELPISKKSLSTEGEKTLKEIKELNNFMKEKNNYLETLTDNDQKFKCLKNLVESCENLIEIYTDLSEKNESENIDQKLFDSYKKLLNYYSEMLIINNDKKIDEDLIDKIKEIFSKLINEDVQNMIDIFDQLKIKKPDKYVTIIIFCAELLYNEGQKILDEGKNYARYYARKFFVRAEKIKNHIDENLINDMGYKVQSKYKSFNEKYMNKIQEIDAFVKSLTKQIKLKDTPYISTGFTSIGQIIDRAMEPENIDLALDILSDMAETMAKDKTKFNELEAFCRVNIIKIKFTILNNQSLNDMQIYESIISRIELIIRRLDLTEQDAKWIKEYNELKEKIKVKNEELKSKEEEEKLQKNKICIEQLQNIYKTKIKEKKPKEFLDFIFDKYPFIGYEQLKEKMKDLSLEEEIDFIFAKYHPDNYTYHYYYKVYNEIYILLNNMKDDYKKYL